jgi:WD40 repeat protein
MANEFFLRRGGKVIGPIASAVLKQRVSNGTFLASDEISKSTTGPWKRVKSVPALRDLISTADDDSLFEEFDDDYQYQRISQAVTSNLIDVVDTSNADHPLSTGGGSSKTFFAIAISAVVVVTLVVAALVVSNRQNTAGKHPSHASSPAASLGEFTPVSLPSGAPQQLAAAPDLHANLFKAAVHILQANGPPEDWSPFAASLLPGRTLRFSANPHENLDLAIVLLEEYLKGEIDGFTPEHAAHAQRIIDYSRSVMSDPKVMTCLLSLSNDARKSIVERRDTDVGVGIPLASLRAFGADFGRPVTGDFNLDSLTWGTTPSKDEYGSEYRVVHFPAQTTDSMIVAAMVDSMLRNLDDANRIAPSRQKQLAKSRADARPANPQSTALIFMMIDDPKRYAGHFIYLDKVKIHADVKRWGDSLFRVGITDDRRKYYPALNNDILFVTPRVIANRIRLTFDEDAYGTAKIYCEMSVARSGHPQAYIYKVALYNRAGDISETITESLTQSEVSSKPPRPDGAASLRSRPSTNQVLELHTLKGHSGSVVSVCFSPDGKRIVTGSMDATVKVWDAETGKSRGTLKGHSGPVLSVTFTPDGKWIVSGSADKTARVWNADTGETVATLRGHSGAVVSVSVSPNGRYIISGSADKTVGLWEVLNSHARDYLGQLVVPFEYQVRRTLLAIHSNTVTSVSVSPNGDLILSASRDKTMRFGDAKWWASFTSGTTKQEPGALVPSGLTITSPYGFTSAEFSPGGGRIVSGNSSNRFVVFNLYYRFVNTLTPILRGGGPNQKRHRVRVLTGGVPLEGNVPRVNDGEIHFIGHSAAVLSVSFSPDGKRIVSGSGDKTAKVWDSKTGKETFTFKGHSGPILSVQFSPDGKRIVTGSTDETVKIWDVSSLD